MIIYTYSFWPYYFTLVLHWNNSRFSSLSLCLLCSSMTIQMPPNNLVSSVVHSSEKLLDSPTTAPSHLHYIYHSTSTTSSDNANTNHIAASLATSANNSITNSLANTNSTNFNSLSPQQQSLEHPQQQQDNFLALGSLDDSNSISSAAASISSISSSISNVDFLITNANMEDMIETTDLENFFANNNNNNNDFSTFINNPPTHHHNQQQIEYQHPSSTYIPASNHLATGAQISDRSGNDRSESTFYNLQQTQNRAFDSCK